MTTEQYFAVLGTIYIAPHLSPLYCQVVGACLLLAALCKSLGWL